MEDKILKLIEENYKNRRKRKEQVYELLEKIKKVSESSAVKEYLNLLEQLNSIDYVGIINRSDEDLLNCAFNQHLNQINNTNEIYLCMGSYMMEKFSGVHQDTKVIKLKDSDPRVQYKIYMDIERNYNSIIPIELCEQFESQHRIIHSKKTQLSTVYSEIQNEFINLSISEGQEAACEKILKREW